MFKQPIFRKLALGATIANILLAMLTLIIGRLVSVRELGGALSIFFLLMSSLQFRLLQNRKDDLRFYFVCSGLAVSAALLGLLQKGLPLVDFGWLTIDISPLTAISMVLIAVAVLLSGLDRTRFVFTTQFLALVVMMLSYVTLLAAVYQVPELEGQLGVWVMSPYAALSFTLLGFSTMLIHPGEGYLREFNLQWSGGRQGRLLLPVVLFAPFFIGYLRMFGHWLNIFSTAFGVALIIGSFTTVFMMTLYFAIRAVNSRDRIKFANALELEARASEQTRLVAKLDGAGNELRKANREFALVNEELQLVNEELRATNEQLNNANVKIQNQASEIVLRKQREIDLSQGTLGTIFDNTEHAYMLFNADGTLRTFNNAAFYFALGQRQVEVNVGDRLFDLVPEEEHATLRSNLKEVEQGKTIRYERRFDRGDETSWFQVTLAPVQVNGNGYSGFCFTIVDISPVRRYERQVQDEKKLLRIIIDHLPINVYVKDLKSRKVLANRAEYEYVGFEREEDVIGKSDIELYPEESSRISLDEDQFVMTTGQAILNRETLNIRKDGHTCDFLVSKIPLRDAGGAIIGLVGISYDISHRKASESKMRELTERFQILSRATNDAIFDWDLKNDTVLWSHGMETVFGYPLAEMETPRAQWDEKIHPDDYIKVKGQMEALFVNHETSWISSFRYQCRDGSYKHVLHRAFIIYRNDKPSRIIGALQDVTEVTEYRQELERIVEARTRELNAALFKEKESIHMKSQFISTASHEFRTPLTTIDITASFLKKYSSRLTPQDIDRKVGVIEKQVKHMTHLLDDVLLIGKAQANKLAVNYDYIALKPFVEELIEEVVENTKQTHRVDLVWRGECQLCRTDAKLMHNILANLLTNAIKFSPHASSVELRVGCSEDLLEIVVSDKGIGIPEREQDTLFESFQRASNATDFQGTGLGLSIVRTAVRMLEGEIRVWSRQNEGSVFTVVLPQKQEEEIVT